jgi:four helix bundle protein
MLRRSSFRELQIWQKGKSLCILLYSITKPFPDDERFGIISQIRRAAVSIPTNIAEGHGRNSNADFSRFLHNSLGSIREIETLIEICVELGYLSDGSVILGQLDEIGKMTSSFICKLEN